MNIICDDINDFCTMITTCPHNDVKVFISKKDSYPNVSFHDNDKDYTAFTYVLLTPLYTAIYSSNVRNSKYDNIYQTLVKCQEQSNHNFCIQIFDKLDFTDNNLYIRKHKTYLKS